MGSFRNAEVAQQNSILFKAPAEVRSLIFQHALVAYDDTSKPFRHNRIYHRPGYHYYSRIDCALIQTCQRIYRETHLLPISLNEHVFWVFNGPLKSIKGNNRNPARWKAWFESLSQAQQQAVQVVHIFIQQFHLEGLVSSSEITPFCFKTPRLHLTLRHSDWWSWESPEESSDRLGICPWSRHRTSCQRMLAQPEKPSLAYIKDRIDSYTWGGQVCQIEGLKTLELEFETDVVKKSQLDVVVARAKSWRFPLINGTEVLEWTGEIEESQWEGLANLSGDYQSGLREREVTGDTPKRDYYVVKMIWRAQRAAETEDGDEGPIF